jgi:ketosteroid isomerase-like protein
MRIQEIREIAFHVTADPQVSVGEAEYTAITTAAAQTFDLSFIVVMRVENGEIIHLRDYMDYLGATVGLNRLPALAKALAKDA